MASALVIVPAIDVFVTRACLRHLLIQQKNTLIINNTGQSAFKMELITQGWDVTGGKTNLGVAASWNQGVHRVLQENYDYLIVTSCAMIYLQGMVDLISKLPQSPGHAIVTGFGWHCKPLPRQQLLDVGKFDEQFFPAYREDTDFERRSQLAGWGGGISFPVSAIDLGAGHGAMKVSVNYEELAEKYLRKWGGDPGEETFVTPYGGQE